MASVASLARIIGPVLGGLLLAVDSDAVASSYGKTPYWTSGAIMLIAFGLAVSLHLAGTARQEKAISYEGEPRS
jgi:hypothetical protein